VMAVVGFVNLTPEDILWRDMPRLRDRLSEHLSAYIWFWLVKSVGIAAVTAVFCSIYGLTHQSWNVAFTVFSIGLLLQLLTVSTLVEVPLFAGLEQQRGAAFVLGVRVLWLALLAPNLWLRSLTYYIVALALYAATTAVWSGWLLRRQFGLRFAFDTSNAWNIVRQSALDLTLWLHLVGRARVFLQRGDLAILGGLGVGLAALGQYTVAVNLVGFALILPGVLENVAAVSFAHRPEHRSQSLRRFCLVAVTLAVAQFACGIAFGRWALRLLHVAEVEASYRIFITLLGGVCGMVVAGPSLAYAMCFRKMQTAFASVFLPAAVTFAVAIWLATKQWAVVGAATTHAAVSLLTGAAVIGVVVLGHDRPGGVEPETAEAESAFQE